MGEVKREERERNRRERLVLYGSTGRERMVVVGEVKNNSWPRRAAGVGWARLGVSRLLLDVSYCYHHTLPCMHTMRALSRAAMGRGLRQLMSFD